MKPEFVDNLDGNTLAAALCGFLDALEGKLRQPVTVRIASGYFNPAGFALLAERLARVEQVQLLLGAEPMPPPATPVRMPGEPRGSALEQRRVREALASNKHGLERDRDRVPFEPHADGAIRRLLEFLRSGKVAVRRYERGFLHGKAYLFGDEEGTVVGSSNFTQAGLTKNLELNLGAYAPHVVSQVAAWFQRLWNEAEPFDLAAVYDVRYELHEPYVIYLRRLWELFRHDLRPDGAVADLSLTAFQRDGVWRARRLMDEHGGVLVADEVGLGKTFLAGDILREYLRERRTRVLVVAPAALRDGPWASFLDRFQLRDAEVVSFEQLQRDERLGAEGVERPLRHDPNDYALVVVDEAQAFRNPEALRSRALRALLRGTPRKRLLLMSATPVNNSVWDLYTLLGYFLENDGVFANRGVPSLIKHFRRVAGTDPEDLQPDALFDVLDATTVRRTRHFIKRYYPGERIRDARGNEITIRFPKPRVVAVNYDLDAALPGVFGRIREALAPVTGEPKLTLARYAPEPYRRRNGTVDARTAALIGLLRSGILKRFESSAFAFCETLRTMIGGFDAFLKGLDEGKVLRSRGLTELEDLSDADEWAELIEDGEWEPMSGYDAPRLRRDVENDRRLFVELVAEVERLPMLDNPKLHALERELATIARQAAREGHGDERDRRKVLIFTFFEDTAKWIYDYLVERTAVKKELAVYRGRVVGVCGETTWGGVSRDEAIYGFAPRSMEAPPRYDDDRFDVLVTTDVLAEGMNLQQCRHIINFDLPWNPMRLVQRHGRVDRIGSPHEVIYLRCILPDRQLDALLELEARLRHKLAQAAATIGLGGEVIPGSVVADKAFAETREEIDRLRRGDAQLFERSGEKQNAHSGEEFRHELLKALEDPALKQRVLALPGAAGAVAVADHAAGHFFCARVGERVFLRFVPMDAGAPLVADTLRALRFAVCDPTTAPTRAQVGWDRAYAAWQRARASIYDEWTWSTDPANIQPKIPSVLRKAADHLRRHPPPDVPQELVVRAIEALEAPRRGRIERLIRVALEPAERDDAPPMHVSRALLSTVEELGLEPYRAPDPLPGIEACDVELVCWLELAASV